MNNEGLGLRASGLGHDSSAPCAAATHLESSSASIESRTESLQTEGEG